MYGTLLSTEVLLLAAPSLTRCDKLYRQPSRCALDCTVAAHSSGGGSLYTNAAAADILPNRCSLYNYISILEIPLESPSDFAGARLLLLDDTDFWSTQGTSTATSRATPSSQGLTGAEARQQDFYSTCGPNDVLKVGRLIKLHGGGLKVHIGDAFCEENDPEEGFAGIVVDLFSNGEVLPVLREAETWLKLKRRLKAGGRIMINCVEEIASDDEGKPRPVDEHLVLHAMLQAFPEGVQYKVNNKMAFTGPFPNVEEWCNAVHEKLRPGVHEWKCFY